MQLPVEPVPDFVVTPGVHLIATAIAAMVWAGVMIAAIGLSRRERSPVPLLFMLGGALTVGYEPIVDILGQCYLPANFQWTLFTVLGRPMPVYAIFVYSAFFGGFAIMSWSHLRGGGAPSGLWRRYLIAIGINTFLFETPAVSIFGVYTYYGDQPFDFWGFPLWWPFVNTAGPLAAGAVVFVLQTHLKLQPLKLWPLSVILVPITDGLSNAGSAYPTWLAMNADVPLWLVWCAGALTIALAVLEVHAAVSLLKRLPHVQLEVSAATATPRPAT